MKITDKVSNLSIQITRRSANEAAYFPVDREFLLTYIQEIQEVNPVEFVLYNLEHTSFTYSSTLFLCLPELWKELDGADIVEIIASIRTDVGYFSLINFAYKYIEVDFIPLIIAFHEHDIMLERVLNYLSNQWHTLLLPDNERCDLEEGMEQEFIKYDPNDWLYIRQRLLLHPQITPALRSDSELYEYVNQLMNKFSSSS